MSKKVGPLILASVLFVVILCLPNSLFTWTVNEAVVLDASSSLDSHMFKGEVIQEEMLRDDSYLPIYGSSELSRFEPFHPTNYLASVNSEVTPFLVGRGGMQSLIHFLNFAANGEELKGKKLVYILSPTWFDQTTGIDEGRFNPNYSKQHAYEFALSELNPELKQKASERLLSFSMVKDDFILSKMLFHEAGIEELKSHEQKILYQAAKAYLAVAEKADLVVTPLTVSPKYDTQEIERLPENITFEQMFRKAEKVGQATFSNNEFSMENELYDTNYRGKIAKLKDKKVHDSYKGSMEYEDFQLVLDILQEYEAKSLIISLPLNGYFYDYMGFPIQERQDYYAKVKNQVEDAGFTFVDLSMHEYEKYFFEDSIHPSLKGWVYIDEAIEAFINDER